MEVPSSGEFHNRGLRSLKRSLFCLKMFTESQARKQNKTALLVSRQWERKATHFSMLPFKSNLSDPDRFMELIRNNSKEAAGGAILSLDDISELP